MPVSRQTQLPQRAVSSFQINDLGNSSRTTVSSSLSDRETHCRALPRKKKAMGLEEISRYAGNGIATLTLIESTVRATIRHSDSEPIASEAATASISRDEAIGAARPLKPAARGDRVMVGILQGAGESPARR
jgi:hypothetical protein